MPIRALILLWLLPLPGWSTALAAEGDPPRFHTLLDAELQCLLPPGHNPTANYLWTIETALGRYGIEIPFPQRDLHLRSVDGKVLASWAPPNRPAAPAKGV